MNEVVDRLETDFGPSLENVIFGPRKIQLVEKGHTEANVDLRASKDRRECAVKGRRD